MFTGCEFDRGRLAIGNCFRTEAEAIRRREALKVQAELRRMPGRCAPPDGSGIKWCIDFDGPPHCFRVHAAAFTGDELLAVAGVWFASEESARHAMDTIGQDRLGVWLDDYLLVPIGGVE